ncbi:metallophosphoesterase [Ligilactobacillus salivarius]|uniref:metallophosphoesterase n=1 Tax=Ligilactobacillus salivarius TaxID=1624 RepID=UPI00191E340A|nr:metallophosphoesterase [Ligilactobacillus salivarius]MBL1057995.1 metallophosphoesterase [Ligilactobacillus salivarius]
MTRTILDLAKPKTTVFDLSNVLNPRVNDDLAKISFHIQYDSKPFNMTGYKMYFISADENMGYINVDGMVDKVEYGDNVGNGDITFKFPANVFKKAGTFDSSKTMFVVENVNSNYIQSTINVSLTVLENGVAKFNADVDQIGYDSKLEQIHEQYKNKAQELLDELINQVQTANNFSDVKETANQAKKTANDSIAKANAVNNEVTTARSRFSNLNDRLNNQDIKINSAETAANASQNYSRLDIKNQQQDSVIATKADKYELENKLSQMKLYPEAFENADAIKKTYPDGKPGIFIAVDTGHQWYWVDGAWKDGGSYQAEGISPALKDIRIANNYQIYDTPGNAVRMQFREILNSLFSANTPNIFNKDTILSNKDLGPYGTLYTRAGFFVSNGIIVSDYIGRTLYYYKADKNGNVDGNAKLYTICAYDDTDRMIDRKTDYLNQYVIPSGTKYIRFSAGNTDVDKMMLSWSEQTKFSPYRSYSTLTDDVTKFVNVRSASGNYLTYPDKAYNLNSQALLNYDLEIGTIYKGENTDSAFRARSQGYVNPKGEPIKFVLNDWLGLGIKLIIVRYDMSGKYLTQFDLSQNGDLDCSYMSGKYKVYIIRMKNDAEDTTPLTLDIVSKLRSSISVVNTDRISELNTNDLYHVPYYWQDYLNDKIATIKDKLRDKNKFGFIYIADSHYNNNYWRSPALIKKIAEDCGINWMIYPGDLINENADKSVVISRMNKIVNDLGNTVSHFLPVVGNHDDNWNGQHGIYNAIINDQEMTGYIFGKLKGNIHYGETGKYYYTDDTIHKVRYVAVDTHDGDYQTDSSDSNKVLYKKYNVSDTQLEFIADALQSTNSDWSIVIFGHVPQFNPMGTTEGVTWTGQDKFNAILESLYSKSTYSLGSKQFDFKNSGTLVGTFFGHIHTDMIKKVGNINHVTIECDANLKNDYNHAKTFMTTTEQVLDIVIVDKQSKHVELIRVGAGEGREFNY